MVARMTAFAMKELKFLWREKSACLPSTLWSFVPVRSLRSLSRETAAVELSSSRAVALRAGQEPLRELEAGLKAKNASVWCIGGADVATELDAKRAIDQGALDTFDCFVTHCSARY